MALGIDLYRKYQSVTDWNAVRNHGVGFAWVKLTDGGGIATAGSGAAMVDGARAAGIPVGGYHYAQLSPSPETQAEVFIREVRRTGAVGCTPMLDLEAPFAPDAGAADFAHRFMRRVAALGFRPGIYYNNAFAKRLRADQWPENPVVWIARYGARPDPEAGRYDIHQYSSSGTVPGVIASGVDLNDSYTNAHLIGAAPTPGKDPISMLQPSQIALRQTSAPGDPLVFKGQRSLIGWDQVDGMYLAFSCGLSGVRFTAQIKMADGTYVQSGDARLKKDLGWSTNNTGLLQATLAREDVYGVSVPRGAQSVTVTFDQFQTADGVPSADLYVDAK
jgi:lysozyme